MWWFFSAGVTASGPTRFVDADEFRRAVPIAQAALGERFLVYAEAMRYGVDERAVAMSTPVEIRDVAPWVERLARVGYAAKAVLYITIGILAAQAAFGPGGRTTDTQGALRVVHDMTFGRIVLLVIAAGLLGYALWRLVEAAVDPDGRGSNLKGLALRAGFAIRGLFHGALGVGAFRAALGDRSAGSNDQAREVTASVFRVPAGELVIYAGAAFVAGYGVYQLYRSYASKLGRQLELGALSGEMRPWVVRVSRFGIAARGVIFCLIGLFLARAAHQHDAREVGGVRESLNMLADLGRWPFAVVALGLIAYGVYEMVNARYRRINVA